MENNLDRYFREKLHQREFEFQEAYWKGAEKLLKEKERRRRFIFAFLWSGLAVAFAIALAVWVWRSETTEAPSGKATVEKPLNQKTTPQAQVFEKAKTETGEPSLSNAGSPFSNDASKTPSTGSILHKQEGPAETANKKSGFALPAFKTGDQDKAVSVAEQETLPVSASEVQSGQQLTATTSLEAQPASPEEKRTPVDLAYLELLQIREVEGVFPKNPKAVVSKNNRSPVFLSSLGISAGELFQTGSAGQTVIGFQAGLVLQHLLKKGWFLSTGLQYQRRGGTFEASKIAESRSYRFGVQLDTQLLKPGSLHYLSMPVLAGWQRGRHVLESGFALDYLVGLRGQKGKYEYSVEPPTRQFQVEEKGWLVEDGYKKFNAGAVLGYRYRVNRQLSFGLSGNYTFGGILENNYQPPVGGFLLKEADRFFLSAQAVYFLK